jgi:RNA polymerase sigma-70 factor (ECF subfamily)
MPYQDRVDYQVLSDEQLIFSFQSGDENAYTEIVNRYKDKLVNFVYRYTGNYDDAEDIVQDTMLKVYINKDLYREIARFSTWVYTIAINIAKTRLVRVQKYKTYSLSNINPEADEEFDLPDEAYLPDTDANAKIQSKYIQNALNRIPEKYKKLVILRDIEELSYEEICEITRLPMGTVKSRINRGREKLQKLLRHIYKE